MQLFIALAKVLVGFLSLSFLLFNGLGGFVAGIWLAIEGEWRVIFVGLGLIMCMPWAWSLASFPAIVVTGSLGASGTVTSRSRTLIAGLFVSSWSAALLAAWTLVVLLYVATQTVQGPAIPLLVWGYATVLAPLAFMMSKEPEDNRTGSSMGLLFAIVLYAVLVVQHLCHAAIATMVVTATVMAGVYAVAITMLLLAMTAPSSQPVPEEA